jgi:hypothetical protein
MLLPQYKISSNTSRFKRSTFLRSLNVHHFKTVESTGLNSLSLSLFLRSIYIGCDRLTVGEIE